MEKFYFYKGMRIVKSQGVYKVIAPAYKNRIVSVQKTLIGAKLWIEGIETQAQLRHEAARIDKIING